MATKGAIRTIRTAYIQAFKLSKQFPQDPVDQAPPDITHDINDPQHQPGIKIKTMLQRFLSKHK